MTKPNVVKGLLAVALLAVAGLMFFRFLTQDDSISEKTFFYDLSEKKLFSTTREALPPIRGLHNSDEVAVRAVVISINGDPRDKASQKIAYLEKYAPELKQNLEKVRTGHAEPLPRNARDGYRLVKRLNDAEWHQVSSPEGEKIMAEWNVPGPDGKYPVVCTP